MISKSFAAACIGAAFAAVSGPALSATLTGVGTYNGVAGVGSSNGDVTNSPAGSSYVYVTTEGSTFLGAGLKIGSETNGSELTTLSFTANAGDTLKYYFNYVASDGTSSFVEYAYAYLNVLNDLGETTDKKLIFHARTTPSGNTVPGFGLPPLDSAVTLTPGSTPILPGSGIGGAPVWAQLGGSSGSCFGTGCGLTGWILATLGVDPGKYSLTFGVVNWGDTLFQNGLAIAGLKIGDTDIIDDGNNGGQPGVVPLPAGAWLLLGGLGGLAALRRRKRA